MSVLVLSSMIALEEFMDRVPRWKVQMEATPLPRSEVVVRAYELETDILTSALRSGSRVRLEAAVLGTQIARGYPAQQKAETK